ncbi:MULTISPECIES: flagellar motor switch protein FliG [Microbacteriaceae]|uniref:Flagellar motor switch protein FliG n=1 Tax=Orlajensenia leifsoniae TaxID=2561933 RepID=A0A4Y9R4E1_9MICO|nr:MULTISPECIES: flagellar motor switch protein FliG [Leifsonia]KQQ95546.1 flagellar motor switch protein FliG [Leifsonia sp. Leaf325]TFV98822.1 flagellar motor switch protein FliG [Leifsonia flava]
MTENRAVLNGAQKAAVVLMNMEPTRAAEVMKQLNDLEAEEITSEIMRLRRVDSATADGVLAEFHELSVRGSLQTRGGRDVAVGLLEASFGAERAAGVLSRVASSMAGRAFEFLDEVDAAQVRTLVEAELPQTIALVLASLRAEHAAAVMAGLEPEARTAVAHAIATMGTATPEAVKVVAETLKSRAGAVVASRESGDAVGGVQPLVDIINRADVGTERAVLDGLDIRDPELAEEVRSRMLTFGDIVRLDRKAVQQVLRGIDAPVLALAMKGAPEPVIEVIHANVSERNRELIDDEARLLGPVRSAQVEEARAEVVRSIRTLEAEGVITLHRAEEDDLVE